MSAADSDNMEEDMDVSGFEEPDESIFWSMKLEPSKTQEIQEPVIDNYIVHITNACFGTNVTKQSRTVVVINQEDEQEIPVCVLRQGQHENHSLDLLFNEAASISLKGQKISTVYLTGYIQPPVEVPLDDDAIIDEDMTEEEIKEALKRQRRQAMLLDDDGDEDEDEDEDDDIDNEGEDENMDQELIEEIVEPPTKKQKTATGSKSTKNGLKSEKIRKSPQQKPVEKSEDKKEEEDVKEEKVEEKVEVIKETNKRNKNKKKKDKKMQLMKGGIKYRDMKVGEGNVISVGDKLSVFYVGQLDDKKVFDKAIKGDGMEFNFGGGEVIKGWDLGLKGMRVGGKRKLVIPPKLGYGANGSPPSIPPNANLTFTIEIKSVN